MTHDHDHDHGHDHGHGHHHHLPAGAGSKRLVAAVVLNGLLVIAQVVAGILSGSLALLADALHNFSDGASVLIALIARKVARKRADHRHTFGYRRAEIVGAMINLTALIILGLYLLGQAVMRFLEPKTIHGWTVVIVAAAAVGLNALITIMLVAGAKQSINIRAAFVHSVADTLASVGVILVGVVVLLWNWQWADPLATLIIASYVLYQGLVMIRQAIGILLESVPAGLTIEQVAREAASVEAVRGVHHLHVWQLDEDRRVMEGHVLIAPDDAGRIETIKHAVKQRLAEKFQIHHAALEFELDQPGSPLPGCDQTMLVPEH